MVGDEVGAAGIAQIKSGLDEAAADRSRGGDVEAEVAPHTGIAAGEDAAGLAQGGVLPFGGDFEGDLVEASGVAEGAFERGGSGVGRIGVGAGGY